MLVPFMNEIRSFQESPANLDWYRQWQMERQGALPAAEVDRLIEARQTALLLEAAASSPAVSGPAEAEPLSL